MATRIPYAKPTRVPRWKDATATTIERIQDVFSMHPWREVPGARPDRPGVKGLTEHSKIRLYEIAGNMVQAQGRTHEATVYWNTFVNTLRMLVAGMSDIDPATIFDESLDTTEK